MKGPSLLGRILLFLLGTLLLAACAPDSTNATPVGVELANDHITLKPIEIGAGRVIFEVDNRSNDLVHEIEVFSRGVDGAVLPVNNSVADTANLTLIDEIEDVLPGSSVSLIMDVEPGTYLIICNLPEHYGNGMWAYLTVTGS